MFCTKCGKPLEKDNQKFCSSCGARVLVIPSPQPQPTPKAETQVQAAPIAEPPRAEAPKAETPKAEAPKAEAPKAEAPKVEVPRADAPKTEKCLYSVVGTKGKQLDVYENRVEILTKASFEDLMAGKTQDKRAVLMLKDCTGTEFSESGYTMGYLKLQLQGMTQSGLFCESSFTFDESCVSNEKMQEINSYINTQSKEIREQIAKREARRKRATELLDELVSLGVLTESEAEAKKELL